MTEHCSQCHKIWTLETRQGVCQWCGKRSTCQTATTKPRLIKSRSNGRKRQPEPHANGYDQLEGDWLLYYEVARTYEHRIPLQDREDWLHDTMIELARAHKRDNKPLPLLRAYRIASLTVALYYRERNRFTTRVCVFNGYPIVPACKTCKNSTGKPCAWLAVRPVESLDSEIIDAEGYRVRLLDTVATDKIEDMPSKWYELNEIRQGLPLRLAEIGYKRLNRIPLDGKDQDYLDHWRKREQKRLF